MRVGHGFDTHRFATGRPLVLGGVRIEHDRGLAGHSDGDALLHAVIDALLGAVGQGDIGGMFPSSDGRWAGADSGELLRQAYEAAGRPRIANIDATVVAEAPRLADHLPAMRAAIAGCVGVDITRINVKATTSDGLGFTGRGEGVAAFAVVLLE
jgi:2-C-methyl-D-erythritol 2,4-cyclodiphosphate synthase